MRDLYFESWLEGPLYQLLLLMRESLGAACPHLSWEGSFILLKTAGSKLDILRAYKARDMSLLPWIPSSFPFDRKKILTVFWLNQVWYQNQIHYFVAINCLKMERGDWFPMRLVLFCVPCIYNCISPLGLVVSTIDGLELNHYIHKVLVDLRGGEV